MFEEIQLVFISPQSALSSRLSERVIILKKGHIFLYQYANLHRFYLHFPGIGILSSHLKTFYTEKNDWEECKYCFLLCQKFAWHLLKFTLKKENGRAFHQDLYHMFSSRMSSDWCSVPVLVGYSHFLSLIVTIVTSSNDVEGEKLCLPWITFLHHGCSWPNSS